MANVTGESRRVKFNPKEQRKQETPAPDGDYTLKIVNLGKPGMDGWTLPDDPKKAPYRRLTLEIAGTESVVNPGKPKQMALFINAKPIEFFIGIIHDLLRAHGYPDEVDLGDAPNYGENDEILRDETLRAYCAAIDEKLEWCQATGKTFRARLAVEEYQGRQNNAIKEFYPSDEFDDAGPTTPPEAEEQPEKVEAPAKAASSTSKPRASTRK